MMTNSRRGGTLLTVAIGAVWAGVVGAGAVSLVSGESVCEMLGACDTTAAAVTSAAADDPGAARCSKPAEAVLVNAADAGPAADQCSKTDAQCHAEGAAVVDAALVAEAPEPCAENCTKDEPCAACQAKKAAITAAFKPINATCPGSGMPVKPGVTTVSHGFTVGFCCQECRAKFDDALVGMKKAYILQHARVINDTCPTCPTMKPSASAVTLYKGFAVGFCGEHCQKAFEAKDDAAKAAYIASVVKPVNAACPNSGEPVAADSIALYRGRAVGFCNTHCRDSFDAKPDAEKTAVVASLVGQGKAFATPAAESCGDRCAKGEPCAACAAKKAEAKGSPAE